MRAAAVLIGLLMLAGPMSAQTVIVLDDDAPVCSNVEYDMSRTGTPTESVGAGRCWVSKVTRAVASGNLVDISIKLEDCNSPDHCNFVAFNDLAGVPDTLIGQSGAIFVGGDSQTEVTVPVTGTATTQTIWVGLCVESSNTRITRQSTGATDRSYRSSAQPDYSDMSGGWNTTGDTADVDKLLFGKFTVCELGAP